MGRYLMLDIGAGTMDVLYCNTDKDIYYKSVISSPTRNISNKVKATKGDLLLTGCEMGGGSISKTLKTRAKKNTVLMSKESAMTIHHDPEKIKAFGITIIKDKEIKIYNTAQSFNKFELTDIQISRIRQIVESFGVAFDFDTIAICAQDHGIPPYGVSHLEFRHKQFSKVLAKFQSPAALLYSPDEIPYTMNRLHSISTYALKLPTKKIYVMDSGMAAILGATIDPIGQSKKRFIVLDIATSHTVGATINNNSLTSFFEYHTKDITTTKLNSLIKSLPEGKILHNQILKEGGHGAYVRDCFNFDSIEAIIITGPMRHLVFNNKLLANSTNLPIVLGAPWGDNMITGTVGLMEAVRLRENLSPIRYL